MLHIVFDIDDVLNNLMVWYVEWLYLADEYKGSKIEYKDIIKNPPHDIFGFSKEKYLQTLDKFRIMMFHTLKPNPIVLDWLKDNGSKAYFSVLTATPSCCAYISANWIMEYFKNYIRTFAFIPSKRENAKDIIYDKTKADWLRRNRADIFIDDSEQNVNEAEAKGIKSYLVKQPWNSGENLETILGDVSKRIEKRSDEDWFQAQLGG